MNHFVTLFDSNYLLRGLVLYRSLVHHAKSFHLWIICFDDLAYTILKTLQLPYITLIALEDFEDEDLLKIKPTRTRQEYCWTCTPATVYYVFNHYSEVEKITYIDADLMFFDSPDLIFQENLSASIFLTEHRYLPTYNKAESNGIYNVQFMMFKRDKNGIQAIQWWRDRCLEWCYARSEDNKFGDQKYLDDWKERFSGVHIVQNLGAGLAPWNASQYQLQWKNQQVFVHDNPLIFYHYHAFYKHPWNLYYLTAYPLNSSMIKLIYKPYIQAMIQEEKYIRSTIPNFNKGISPFFPEFTTPKSILSFVKKTVLGCIQKRYYWSN